MLDCKNGLACNSRDICGGLTDYLRSLPLELLEPNVFLAFHDNMRSGKEFVEGEKEGLLGRREPNHRSVKMVLHRQRCCLFVSLTNLWNTKVC